MEVTINEDEAKLLIDALSAMHRDYLAQYHNCVGYSSKSKNEMQAIAIQAYDLCVGIESQLSDHKEREARFRDQPKKIDPYDHEDWVPNDPRGW